MTTLRLGATKLSVPKLAAAGAVVAVLAWLAVTASGEIPSAFHGKWDCDRASGTYEIAAKYIAYKTPHAGRALSPGNWRGDLDSVKESGGTKVYVKLKNAPVTLLGLRMVGNSLEIDGGSCRPTY
jgi:hypothetical protein